MELDGILVMLLAAIGPILSEYVLGGLWFLVFYRIRFFMLESGDRERFFAVVNEALVPAEAGKKFYYWPSILVITACLMLMFKQGVEDTFYGPIGMMIGAMTVVLGGAVFGESNLPAPKQFSQRFSKSILLNVLFRKKKRIYRWALTEIVKRKSTPVWRVIAQRMVSSPRRWGAVMLEATIRENITGLSGPAVAALAKSSPERLDKMVPELLRSRREEIGAALLENVDKMEAETAANIVARFGENKSAKWGARLELAQEVEASRNLIQRLNSMRKLPEYEPYKNQLNQLFMELSDGPLEIVKVIREVVTHLEKKDQWGPFLGDWKKRGEVHLLVPVLETFMPLKASDKQSLLTDLLYIEEEEVFEILKTELLKVEKIEEQTILDWSWEKDEGKRKMAFYLANRLPLEQQVEVLFTGMSDDAYENRILVMENLREVDWQPEFVHLIESGFKDPVNAVYIAALTTVEKQKVWNLLPILLKLRDKLDTANKTEETRLKKLRETIFFMLQEAPYFNGLPDYLFCTGCGTRSKEKIIREWTVPVCRTCEEFTQLVSIETVTAYIGPEEAVKPRTQKDWTIPVWDPENKTIMPIDFDRLLIKGGADLDYDWAGAAIVELIELREKTTGKLVKIDLQNSPPLSTNTLTLLNTNS